MVSVIIPTFNSSAYFKDCLKSVSKYKEVKEIIVSDDCSDKENVESLKNLIFKSPFKNKIKLIENSSNKGAFYNKLNSIKNAQSDFVYVLDSDNLAGFNIDNIFRRVIEIGDESKLFIPSKIYHFYNHVNYLTPMFKTIYGKFELFSNEDLIINSSQIRNIFQGGENIMFDKNKSIYWILNIGNFILPKDKFLKDVKNDLNFSREILSMDAVAFTYYWLHKNNELFLLNDHYHFHRKRMDSVSWTEKESSKISRNYFDSLFLKVGN